MHDESARSRAYRAFRTGAWVALPLLAVVVLRLFAPQALDPGGGSGWLAPSAAGLLAVTAAAAALLFLVRAFGFAGVARDLLQGAGLGAVAASAASLALAGPAAAAALPGEALTVGLLAGGIAVLAGELVPERSLQGRVVRLVAAALVFAWIEVAPAVALVAPTFPDLRVALSAAAAFLLGVAAISAAAGPSGRRRADWLAVGAAGAAAIALARPGCLDVIPGIAALAVAAVMAAIVGEEAGARDMRALHAVRLLSSSAAGTPAPASDDATRLSHELRGTIAELAAARATIELQRAELDRAVAVDPVTSVASRRAILDRLHLEVAGARRYAHPIALVMIDLDGMAALNRGQGIEIGDAILRELGLRLRMRMREADAVGRAAGDRFLVILPHTDERGATVFADAVRTKLTARPIDSSIGPVSVTVSIGITMMHQGDATSEDELLGRAEEAVASARAAGGNRIAFDRSHGLARLEDRRPGNRPETGGRGSAEGA